MTTTPPRHPDAPDPPPTPPTPVDPGDEIVQMNVRVKRRVRDAVDARRAVKGLSRDKWVGNALVWALDQHPAAQPLTNTQGRTAPPPHTR